LYLLLYGEALNEKRWDFLYFKYWNILEMIARGKDYVGRPLLDWQGNTIHNKKHEARKIRDDAKELVFELLREDLSTIYSETSFSFNLKQGKISELIQIWYRHRNCVVHRGACLPNDATSCSRINPQYVCCKNAYDEMVQSRASDGYLNSLQDIVRIYYLLKEAYRGVKPQNEVKCKYDILII